MEFHDKYDSELRDEDIIPFTTEALDIVETVISFFCDCLNKDNPKLITLTNGKLSPKKEDINLHPSLDGDPTEKICQKTSLYKNATVFQYDKTKNTEMINNNLNTSFDDCIQDTEKIINKIENEFQNKQKYNDTLILSSDSEEEEEDIISQYSIAKKDETEIIIGKNEKEYKKNNEVNSHDEALVKNLETTPKEKDSLNKSQTLSILKEKKESQIVEEAEDANSLDFPLEKIENHSNKAEREVGEEFVEENDKDPDDNFNVNDSVKEINEEFNENSSKSSSKEQLSKNSEKEIEASDVNGNNGNEGDNEIESEKDNVEYIEQKIMTTPIINNEEMSSKSSSHSSLDGYYLKNAQFLHDSNDNINFIPLQEKERSNRIRWKYHIKHHSTNKKLKCSNFLIYWSQPSKINPVPKATAEMWMNYYHTTNSGRNDATITYRFNGYYNTHEINVNRFMKEYKKYISNPYIEITKEKFPTLYTPLVLNPKKWLPELIRSKLLISNDIMNKVLVN
ncbi:hypothetical protein BCR36DRAFT_359905 [Piromyces finnis]|uniref:Uncharacterized protein n=1 Tax=Piromyces finnis TaxID=1754191 RepID=A0A1Y1V153_9FUNG|nr:hypothetical protein BCR36DRAFT_359905 [Piromyces finnis]|eukprot:ORX44368.1 hypothetical protein BCR36DRAFT_359905 [Piromyces finnis]